MLKGIAASAGVSVAKVYKLETPKVVIEKKSGVAADEIAKLGMGTVPENRSGCQPRTLRVAAPDPGVSGLVP